MKRKKPAGITVEQALEEKHAKLVAQLKGITAEKILEELKKLEKSDKKAKE